MQRIDDSFTVNVISSTRRSTVMILASSMDLTIGANNDIPWSCKTDMKFFKRATTGNVVIMGRKTFESMGSKPLSNRVNIIVSTSLSPTVIGEDTIIVSSVYDALKHARSADLTSYTRNTEDEHIFIIGGVKIYDTVATICDELLYSKIDVDYGVHGYGRDVLIDKVLPRFSNVNLFNTDVLYFNDGSVATGDNDNLREIRHYYKINTTNKFNFKR